MITLGNFYKLTVVRKSDLGYMLRDNDSEVLLHYKQSLSEHEVNDEVKVFIYADKERRLTATEITPFVTLDKPGYVNVVDVIKNVGVFVNINTPNATTLYQGLAFCPNLTDVNIIAPNCTNIVNIFDNCTNLTNIHLEFNNISSFANMFKDYNKLANVEIISNSITNLSCTFYNCCNLTNAPVIPDSVTAMDHTFHSCYNLINGPSIPNGVTNMYAIFYQCYNLVNAPDIPSSATNIQQAFDHCIDLVNAPIIPNTISSMHQTFYGCTSLVNAPVIPDSVTDISYCFHDCKSLINAPVIPNSVTNIEYTFAGCTNLITSPIIPNSVTGLIIRTFSGCTNLSGNIYIHSNQIMHATDCFEDTSLTKNVYIPFEYENGVATQTYNAFIAAGYNTNGTKEGVYLKDIDGIKITINPTPADATVLMYNENVQWTADLSDFIYTDNSGDIEIQALNTQKTDIVIPSVWT